MKQWVSDDRTVLVRECTDELLEVATRRSAGDTWGPPKIVKSDNRSTDRTGKTDGNEVTLELPDIGIEAIDQVAEDEKISRTDAIVLLLKRGLLETCYSGLPGLVIVLK